MGEQWNPAEGLVDHAELASLVGEGVERLRRVMTEGHSGEGLSLPVLDPYQSGHHLSQSLAYASWLGALGGDFELAVNRPRLEGLSTIRVSALPRLHLGERRLTFTLSFDRLRLTSAEFRLRGDHRLLFFPFRVKRDGALELVAEGVALELSFAVGVDGEVPVVSSGESHCAIERIALDIEGVYLLDRLLPLFRKVVEAQLSELMVSALDGLINRRLRALAASQHDLVGRMRRLVELKRAQGFDLDGDGTPDRPRVLAGFGGIGQFPLPLFWQLPAVDVAGAERITLEELCREAGTGDVLLFSGSHASSQGIRRATQSCFSHVALAIREPAIADGRLCLFQATTSSHVGVLRRMERKAGIQLNDLGEVLADYRRDDREAVICWRRLARPPRDPAVEAEAVGRLVQLVERLDGRPYTDDMEGLYVMGLMEVDNPDEADYFCAGLVAESLMTAGVLGRTFRQYQYAPRDFSIRQQALPFSDPAMVYGGEVVVEV